MRFSGGDFKETAFSEEETKMDRALYVAMSGAKQNIVSQAARANNLANASTTGFRRDFEQARSMPVWGEHFPTRAYAMSERPASDFNSGALIETGRRLDAAIEHDGWFVVQAADGKEAYTRRGDFSVDSLGRLLTGNGLQVYGDGGPIVLPPYETIYLGDDGSINIRAAGDGPDAVAEVDRLRLVRPDLADMEKGPDGLFRVKDRDPDIAGPFPPDPNIRIETGFLENSNVNTVTELVHMMALNRQYEMNVKMMKTSEENSESTLQIMRLS